MVQKTYTRNQVKSVVAFSNETQCISHFKPQIALYSSSIAPRLFQHPPGVIHEHHAIVSAAETNGHMPRPCTEIKH